MHPDAHFTEEELRSGQYISVSEFNDCRRENDKECYHRVAGLNDQIVPQEEAAYLLLTKHFDSSISNHMDARKHSSTSVSTLHLKPSMNFTAMLILMM
jgi:hypothetical protein